MSQRYTHLRCGGTDWPGFGALFAAAETEHLRGRQFAWPVWAVDEFGQSDHLGDLVITAGRWELRGIEPAGEPIRWAP